MSRKTRRFPLSFLLLTLCCLAVLPAAVQAQSTGPIAVVANPKVQVKDVSMAELRKIFLGDRQFWGKDLKVTLLIPPPTSHERSVLFKSVYQKTEPQYRRYWVGKLFKNEATETPREVESEELALRFLRTMPGAISVVSADKIPTGVSVLTVDGKKPGDGGYPLK